MKRQPQPDGYWEAEVRAILLEPMRQVDLNHQLEKRNRDNRNSALSAVYSLRKRGLLEFKDGKIWWVTK